MITQQRAGLRQAGPARSYNVCMLPLLLSLLLAVPPLTEAQRDLSEQTTDRAGFDEAGLYALLPNVQTWRAGDETGAAVPDYAALLADPAAHRGDVFLLEGAFAGRSRRVGLSNPGDYGDEVTEWVIVTDPARDQVAVIFFVDPAGELQAPAKGQAVRTAARFYKVWSDLDANGKPTDYLLFVAHQPTLVAAASAKGASSSAQAMLPALLLVILLAAGLLVVVRKSLVKPIAPRRLSHDDAEETAEQLEAHLPVDPADALDELSRRHE